MVHARRISRFPTRLLLALAVLVTLALAGLATARVHRLIALDAAPVSVSAAGEATSAEALAGAIAAREAGRLEAGREVTRIGLVFLGWLGLLVVSLAVAVNTSRKSLRAARAATADADRVRAQLVEAVENINEGFVLYDSDDRLVLCNRKFREAYKIVADLLKPGVTSEQILRAATERGQFPQAGGDREAWIARRLEQRRRFAPPFEQQLAGGRWHMVSDRSTRDGGLVGVRTDITELKRREFELREARQSLEDQAERMRALAEETQLARAVLQDAIESINEGFCLFDSEDRLVMCNSRYRDLHRRVGEAIRPGVSFVDISRAAVASGHLVVKGDVEEAIAARASARRHLADSSVEEQYDDERWVRVSTRRMRNGGIVSVFADITGMKQREIALTSAQARLETQTREMSELAEAANRANRAKSDFLAMMSHEIRTPLNGVISALNLVGDAGSPGDDARLIATARSGAHSLLAILNDILDMSKIEAGMITLDQRPFALRQMIDTVVDLCRVQASAKGLTFYASIDADLPACVSGDADRIRQMVLNYATNAIKFTDRGGVAIQVSRAAGDLVRFSVIDTGIGIPAERHGQVFNDFVQLDQSIRRKHGGTGLGLAITRRLARVMNGAVGFSSEPGQGSTFWFEVPLPKSDARPAEDAGDGGATTNAAARGLRILLAEDNQTNRYLAHLMLERMGCAVTDVEDGAAAVEAAARETFDLVLMDISMPVMDGLEATRRIRASGNEVPVVALSANTGPDFEAECLAAGMRGCLTKPIDVKALGDRLAAIAGAAPRVESAPATATGLFDPGALASIHDDLGAETFARIVAGCRADIDAELSALDEAWSGFPATVAGRDVSHAAHKLVSLAATIGAHELARLARLVEGGKFDEVDRETFDRVARASVEMLDRGVANLAARTPADDAEIRAA